MPSPVVLVPFIHGWCVCSTLTLHERYCASDQASRPFVQHLVCTINSNHTKPLIYLPFVRLTNVLCDVHLRAISMRVTRLVSFLIRLEILPLRLLPHLTGANFGNSRCPAHIFPDILLTVCRSQHRNPNSNDLHFCKIYPTYDITWDQHRCLSHVYNLWDQPQRARTIWQRISRLGYWGPVSPFSSREPCRHWFY